MSERYVKRSPPLGKFVNVKMSSDEVKMLVEVLRWSKDLPNNPDKNLYRLMKLLFDIEQAL